MIISLTDKYEQKILGYSRRNDNYCGSKKVKFVQELLQDGEIANTC